MRTSRNFLVFAAAVILVLGLSVFLRPQVARHTAPDNNVIFQQDYWLASIHPGDLVVLGETLFLAGESRVQGSAALIADTVRVSGVIDGDLTAIGQTIIVEETARITGNASLMGENLTIAGQIDGNVVVNGGSLTIDPGARLAGTISTCVGAVTSPQEIPIACTSPGIEPFAPFIALRNSALPETFLSAGVSSVEMLVATVFGALALIGTSVLGVTFFPRQISHIEEAMRARPRSFGGVGIAVYALLIGLFFALTFLLAVFPPLGLILVPVFLLLGLALLLFSLSGLVTLAVILGDWLLNRSARVPQPPLVAAVAGSVALSALVAVVALLPFGLVISFLLLGLFCSVGLGASIFTRVGTRPVGRTYFVQG